MTTNWLDSCGASGKVAGTEVDVEGLPVHQRENRIRIQCYYTMARITDQSPLLSGPSPLEFPQSAVGRMK